MLRRRSRLLAGALAGAVVAGVVSMPMAAWAEDGVVATGENFTVTQVPAGYEVTVQLDEALPIVSDAPTIVVDGVDLGIAVESVDGTSLTAFTSDPAVASARSVASGWASQPVDGSAQARAVEAPAASELEALVAEPNVIDADPTSIGDVPFEVADYDFGDQAVDLINIGGIRGEMEGRVYLPTTKGPHPTVILLHGRHSACYNPDTRTAGSGWPCAGANPVSIPSYAGYDGTGEALASHGYSVVSISANAINANDNQLALDLGASARGQLILDSLGFLEKADAGEDVSFFNAVTGTDVSFADALGDGLEPADFVGKFDFDNVGIMGHSRGGEGATYAVTLNAQRQDPYGITAVLPLAPVDFGRMTVPGVPMQVILPYCDGDVSNQQGQHMLDDSRYAFGDDVLRTGTWVMGANHNFFNTVWTPGLFPAGVSDDWSGTNPASARATDPTCGTAPSSSATSIRLSAEDQYDLGTAYMAGYFRLAMGDEQQFLPMFDGSGQTPAIVDGADVRSVTTAPATERATIASFESASSSVRQFGTGSVVNCASLAGRTVPTSTPACSTLASAQVPHWTPASRGINVPATPVGRFQWTSQTGETRVTVPAALRDANGFDRLSVKMAADEIVPTGSDIAITVRDGAGRSYSSPVSALNPYATNRLPSSPAGSGGATTLGKIVLQQVNVPTQAIADAGVNLADIREVGFKAAALAGQPAAGGVYLSDLAFENSSLGTASARTENAINVAGTAVDEGDGPATAGIAVYLDRPAEQGATGWVSVLGSTGGRGGVTMERVDFKAGEQCKVVTAPIQGDTAASTSASTSVTLSVINTNGAVMGRDAYGILQVREDDGILPATDGSTLPALPTAGQQGDACAELTARSQPGSVAVSAGLAKPGDTVTFTAGGFRVGESVAVTVGGLAPQSVVADAQGAVSYEVVLPEDITLGGTVVGMVGSGSGYAATGSLVVSDTVFTDVKPGDLFFQEIYWLSTQGITTGYPDGTFRPVGSVERQAMAAFLYRFAGSPEVELPSTSPFSDVPVGHQFFKEIVWLSESGVTTGYPDGTFRPDGSVERQAMAAFLYRTAGSPEVETPTGPVFADVPAGRQFAKEIAWLSSTGITTGYPDSTFRPDNPVERGAMAAFLYRFDQMRG